MIKQIIILACLYVGALVSFDPKAINYCDLKCGEEENTACHCEPLGHRFEDLDNLQLFRKRILERHNDIRSRMAANRDEVPFAGEAANMNILSYNLELEYLARCYAVKYVFHNDKCRRTSTFSSPGQIIGRFMAKQDMVDIFVYLTAVYLKQIRHLTNTTIEHYSGRRLVRDLAEMIWWSHTHVGCARAYNPHAILKYDTYIVVCNYAGTKMSSVEGEPVYIKGTPCSQCANNGKCNENYLKLCGTMEPVPNDTLTAISHGAYFFSECMLFRLICFIFWQWIAVYIL